MSRVIVASHPSYGHVKLMQAIAVDLAERGHDVVFVTGSHDRETIIASGLRFASSVHSR